MNVAEYRTISGILFLMLSLLSLALRLNELRLHRKILSDCFAIPSHAKRLLGVVDADLFVPGLNIVFGLAYGNTAILALTRLKPEFYGEEKDELLFRKRALKEAIHELGHTFGLAHCPDKRCIMHFSNNLAETDIKGPGFCRVCSARLE